MRLARPYALSHGARAAAFAEMAGIRLVAWQRAMLSDWGAIDEGGGFVHRRCGASIPRQSGKSVDAVSWTSYCAGALGMKVLYTAHNYSTTCEMLRRIRQIYGRRPGDPTAEHPRFNRMVRECNNKTAQEAIFLKNGGSIHFSTRTKSATLGYSFDVVIYDEAQELTDEQMQAIMPTTTSGEAHNAQSVFVGTPPRPGGAGDVFEHARDDALAGGGRADDLCWWEYGVEEVGDVADESRWYQANPSLGDVASAEAIRMGMHMLTELAFAQEYLGYWLPKGHADPAIPADAWRACEACAADRPKDAKRAFGVKFSTDGQEVALAAALDPDEGPSWVELVKIEDTAMGTSWLADWLTSRVDDIAVAVIDGRSGAKALYERIAGAFPKGALVLATASDAIAAASTLRNCVVEGTVAWFGPDGNLGDSALSSPRRAIGSGGGWGFGGDDAAPVEAAALALWGVLNTRRDQRAEQEIW